MQLFVNDLTVIDFSYLSPTRGIVGESWIVDVVLTGQLNQENMVLDFGIVKKQIKAIIDEEVDHKLLLPLLDSRLTVTESQFHSDHEWVDYHSDRGDYFLQSPRCAFAHIVADTISTDTITDHLIQVIMPQLPGNVAGLMLTLRPENITTDYYHYSHGLRQHNGNCQRIAHGHRSQIQLFTEQQRNHELERLWCKRWQDIYIASEVDAIELDECQLSPKAKNLITPAHRCFAYHAPQGRFDIAVPQSVLELVDCDSTVELLADYIHRTLKRDYDVENLTVMAFEGVGKGAIVGDR
jgi:6-pyruvoyl-tetrahydropterin synthase